MLLLPVSEETKPSELNTMLAAKSRTSIHACFDLVKQHCQLLAHSGIYKVAMVPARESRKTTCSMHDWSQSRSWRPRSLQGRIEMGCQRHCSRVPAALPASSSRCRPSWNLNYARAHGLMHGHKQVYNWIGARSRIHGHGTGSPPSVLSNTWNRLVNHVGVGTGFQLRIGSEWKE